MTLSQDVVSDADKLWLLLFAIVISCRLNSLMIIVIDSPELGGRGTVHQFVYTSWTPPQPPFQNTHTNQQVSRCLQPFSHNSVATHPQHQHLDTTCPQTKCLWQHEQFRCHQTSWRFMSQLPLSQVHFTRFPFIKSVCVCVCAAHSKLIHHPSTRPILTFDLSCYRLV